jgi:Transposase IS116/IS110/IS902 family
MTRVPSTASCLAAGASKGPPQASRRHADQPPPWVGNFSEQVWGTSVGVVNVVGAEFERYFDQHPAAVIYRSQPGVASKLGPRLLGEFGDDPHRYTSAKARKNYAGTSPITRQSGRKRTVAARFVHNDRLLDALSRQAQAAISISPGARAYYDQLRARGVGHQAALRQLANRQVGILHGCLASGRCYDEATAWPRPADCAAA